MLVDLDCDFSGVDDLAEARDLGFKLVGPPLNPHTVELVIEAVPVNPLVLVRNLSIMSKQDSTM